MADFEVTYDKAMLERTVRGSVAALEAVRKTLEVQATGQVVTSIRKKIASDKGKPLHGAAIANILRKKGIDAFKYPTSVESRNIEFLNKNVEESIAKAHATEKPQDAHVKIILRIVAIAFANWVKSNLLRGGLGHRAATKKFSMKRWERMAKLGRATAKYGLPPPRGVMTGRFAEGVRGILNVGRGAPR